MTEPNCVDDFNSRCFVSPSIEIESRWLVDEIQRLSRMRTISTDWDACGADPPNDAAIAEATRVLQYLNKIGLRPMNTEPSTDEGVCIAFRRNNRYADIECFNSCDILAMKSDGTNPPEVWEVPKSGIPAAIETIRRFLGV